MGEYLKSVTGSERKSALMVLMEMVRDGNEDLCDDAIELVGEYGKIDSDNIRQCYTASFHQAAKGVKSIF